ncbi:elicitor-responsive protein 3-like [Cornus florida]|uniref:elicitor-responsive protein 3-like n=1 Tax=Cornus florida TaxID=4283 RepID=UPI0028984EDA|nr:elicitor-responsive protein 3-like [Cornus florida]
MSHATLEVLLVSAKALENNDFLCNMDPYAIITCRSQEKKSSVASGKGSDPRWNETFVFTLSDMDVSELRIKIMDKDTFTADDFVGEAIIPLESVFHHGKVQATSYKVAKDKKYCGEIKVALTFTPQRDRGGYSGGGHSGGGYSREHENNIGGWRESSRDY